MCVCVCERERESGGGGVLFIINMMCDMLCVYYILEKVVARIESVHVISIAQNYVSVR